MRVCLSSIIPPINLPVAFLNTAFIQTQEEELDGSRVSHPGPSYLAETGHGVPVHPLTLAVTLQTHGSVGKFPHFPGRDRDACIIDLRADPRWNIDWEPAEGGVWSTAPCACEHKPYMEPSDFKPTALISLYFHLFMPALNNLYSQLLLECPLVEGQQAASDYLSQLTYWPY